MSVHKAGYSTKLRFVLDRTPFTKRGYRPYLAVGE